MKKLRYEFLRGLRNLDVDFEEVPTAPSIKVEHIPANSQRSKSLWTTCFCQKLAAVRKACHLSQKELAIRAGVTPGYISKLERGRGIDGLSFAMILSLTNALNIYPGALFTYTEVEEEWARYIESQENKKLR